MTLEQLYEQLQDDAKAKGVVNGQVWHEADIEGHHLYMADTSFGDGPIFRCDQHSWAVFSPDDTGPYAITINTKPRDLRKALELAERASWAYRLTQLGQS